MESVYIKNCKTFGDALNQIMFELRIPEYYDPNLPNYYKQPRKSDPPILNGEIVTWDEYYARFPEERNNAPKSFIPLTIFKSEDMNMTDARLSVSDIIDMCENNVPFDFVKYSDIEWVIMLMDGYVHEVQDFILYNKNLERYISRLRKARQILSEVNEQNKIRLENLKPADQRRPKTLAEILSALS